MIQFFHLPAGTVYAVEVDHALTEDERAPLSWLFGQAAAVDSPEIEGRFVGPRREMITPWSTNAVEITQNMGLKGISRIEEYLPATSQTDCDPMLQRMYDRLDQRLFTTDRQPDPIVYIDDIADYNRREGLALSDDEVRYLNDLSHRLGRKLTDSEVFGFSQVNSEHCRHKIFGGKFVIDGVEQPDSLFAMIKRTSSVNPNGLVSAYKDNVAFNAGPTVEQFAPASADGPDFFVTRPIPTVLALKAETHNFPTTVEPFNGAATGTGGEIRDRLGGGRASLPLAGTAVYMTAYPRTDPDRAWERVLDPRSWLYQTPAQILVKASNGASDFGNKFGQPLICGSLLTFEYKAPDGRSYAYDKVIMLAGGMGFANRRDALKGQPEAGEKVVVLGGDNYRIGMGGGAVSSVDTGRYASGIELNAVQRANPEMQKRAANVIRALAESDDNPIVSIHDHGAGGHLNCLSELVEATGGRIDMDSLPVGDPTLSAREIIGNESQERMGLLIKDEDTARVRRIAERERAPMYVVGETTGDMRFVFAQRDGTCPIDLRLEDMFGNPPRTLMEDTNLHPSFPALTYRLSELHTYLENVLQMEAVACKDWLTNKADRSVTGRVARQQCVGELQLPLSDLGAVALDFHGRHGMATSIGHAPQAALVDPAAGSRLAIAEALTNIVFAHLADGLRSVSLSANWMWPCRNPGEDARLYHAVEAASDFACALGINIPTGKDSLSMTQKYGEEKVLAPGTVIISAAAEVSDIHRIVSPVLSNDPATVVYYVDFSGCELRLGGSAFAQSLGSVGSEVPDVLDTDYFRRAFEAVQSAVGSGLVQAGHDVSAGGMLVALLEMCFANVDGGLEVDLDAIPDSDLVKILFSENPAVLLQVPADDRLEAILREADVRFYRVARPTDERHLLITKDGADYHFGIDYMRDVWYRSSYLLDRLQSGEECAATRYEQYKMQPLRFRIPDTFVGSTASLGLSAARTERSGVRAAILRDKGTNGEREMAYALYLAGFDVKDVHLTDLATGRETLDDIDFAVFCGGFSNSDVLGSAKGWAAGILHNDRARSAINRFYDRPDTLSLGVCNGCQLMAHLGLLYPDHTERHALLHNRSHKFESSFVTLDIPQNDSVMLGSLSGARIGVWVAHGEGRFDFPYEETRYRIAARYSYDSYPANPNGSQWGVAALTSADGRHLAMMPHPERSIFPWQCAHYPADRRQDEVTPWMQAFVNARRWVESKRR
ncbi:MAG: phosphoribosylformylglycinamidine synthase [Tannerella sp.]